MTERIVRADSRGRISLGTGKANQYYLASRRGDDILLEPAIVTRVSPAGAHLDRARREVDDEGGLVSPRLLPRDPEEAYL